MSDPRIKNVHAREVWDSRGRPTIEVEVTLMGGAVGRSIAPSGASTGRREALDLRDGGKRLAGFGVRHAVGGVNGPIATLLNGMDATAQIAIDAALIELDGTPQKTVLGGNALVATSCAIAWAAAAALSVPLWQHLRILAGMPEEAPHIPLPMIQIFGGGRHAGNRVDVQDFLVAAIGAKTFAEACEWTGEIYAAAGAANAGSGGSGGIADEGGHWPDFAANEEGLERLTAAIEAAGFAPGRDVGICLDVAASSFFSDGAYTLALEGRALSNGGMVELMEQWVADYAIVSLEDPLAEDDDAGFAEITRRLGGKVQLIGDDYLVTSAERIAGAASIGACNSALLKANQCGTITELVAAVQTAKALGWNTIMSGRSGESEDVTLSHLAVGLMADQIKVGSMARSERTSKWNEVIRIEETMPAGSLWRWHLPGA